jgi:hypothetical protein
MGNGELSYSDDDRRYAVGSIESLDQLCPSEESRNYMHGRDTPVIQHGSDQAN